MDTSNDVTFKSSYLLRLLRGDLNPFTPDTLAINDDFVEHKRRNWYLISSDAEDMHWQRIVGVTVDKHLLGATVRIKGTGGFQDSIVFPSVSKRKANKIKEICQRNIKGGRQFERTNFDFKQEATIKNSMGGGNSGYSVADEILKFKSLLDEGVITQEEFDSKKKDLLS